MTLAHLCSPLGHPRGLSLAPGGTCQRHHAPDFALLAWSMPRCLSRKLTWKGLQQFHRYRQICRPSGLLPSTAPSSRSSELLATWTLKAKAPLLTVALTIALLVPGSSNLLRNVATIRRPRDPRLRRSHVPRRAQAPCVFLRLEPSPGPIRPLPLAHHQGLIQRH